MPRGRFNPDGSHNDPPLPPWCKAYLKSFDRYLLAVREGTAAEEIAARVEMRECCDTMLDVAEVDRTSRKTWQLDGSSRRGVRRAA